MAWHIAGAQHMFAVIIVSLIKSIEKTKYHRKYFLRHRTWIAQKVQGLRLSIIVLQAAIC